MPELTFRPTNVDDPWRSLCPSWLTVFVATRRHAPRVPSAARGEPSGGSAVRPRSSSPPKSSCAGRGARAGRAAGWQRAASSPLDISVRIAATRHCHRPPATPRQPAARSARGPGARCRTSSEPHAGSWRHRAAAAARCQGAGLRQDAATSRAGRCEPPRYFVVVGFLIRKDPSSKRSR